MEDRQAFRTCLIEVLKLLASKESQDTYQRHIPHIDIAPELEGMWFNGSYDRSDRLKGYCNELELRNLAEFSEYYRARVAQLPARYAEFWGSPIWQEISAEAEKTLIKSGWLKGPAAGATT